MTAAGKRLTILQIHNLIFYFSSENFIYVASTRRKPDPQFITLEWKLRRVQLAF